MTRQSRTFTEAIRLDSKIVMAYNNRGGAYMCKGEHEKAVADFTEAIRLDPKFAPAYNNRSHVYATRGDFYRAALDRTKAEELSDNRNKASGVSGPLR